MISNGKMEPENQQIQALFYYFSEAELGMKRERTFPIK